MANCFFSLHQSVLLFELRMIYLCQKGDYKCFYAFTLTSNTDIYQCNVPFYFQKPIEYSLFTRCHCIHHVTAGLAACVQRALVWQ